MNLTLLVAWPITLILAATTVSSVARMARTRKGWRDPGYWLAPLMFGSATVIALTILGAIGVVPGAVLAVAPLSAIVALMTEPWRELAKRRGKLAATLRILSGLASHVRAVINLRDDLRALLRLRSGPEPRRTEAPPPVAPVTDMPRRDVPPAREVTPAPAVPSVRDDPALGAVPAAEEVSAGLAGAGVAVPPAWAALIAEVAAFEPADDEELRLHLAGEAAGALGWGEGVRARADNLLHATGLDPAYVAGHLELADEIADLAAAVALVDRRFHVIYGAIREWVGNGGILPHRAREFFGGTDATPAADVDDEAA